VLKRDEVKKENGEDCILESTVTYTPNQIILGDQITTNVKVGVCGTH
jgi:hypothetical protein